MLFREGGVIWNFASKMLFILYHSLRTLISTVFLLSEFKDL